MACLSESAEVSVNRSFGTTHWSVICLAANVGSAGSLEAWQRLAQSYWYPLYGFVRQAGHTEQDAKDLTQAFFAFLIERERLAGVIEGKGRFRSFLLTCLKNFLVSHHRKAKAAFRSPITPVLSLNELAAEERFQLEGHKDSNPEVSYEKRWARSMVDESLSNVEAYYENGGQLRLFKELIAYLIEDGECVPYAELGQRLQMTESAIRNAMYRLKRRLNLEFRAVVVATVPPDEVEDEIQHIHRVLTA